MTLVTDASDNITPKTRALAAYIEAAVKHLSTRPDAGDTQDGLLFLGNRQDAIPRLLIFDPVLDATAVRICMILRTLCQSGTVATAFPTYDQIARHANLARATVARVLILLRATRWLTLLARKIRSSKGQIKGNIYTLHDEPLPLADTLALDPDYIDFLQSLRGHPHSHARRIARLILASIQDDITEQRDVTSLQTLAQTGARCRAQRMIEAPDQEPLMGDDENHFFAIAHHHLKELHPHTHLVQNLNQVEKFFNDDLIQNLNYVGPVDNSGLVQILNQADRKDDINNNQQLSENVKNFYADAPVDNSRSTHSSSYIYKKTTTTTTDSTRVRETDNTVPGLVFPAQMTETERKLSLVPLGSIDAKHQQAVLDELAGQIQAKKRKGDPIRNPLSYLAHLCKRVQDGTFVPCTGVKVAQQREMRHAATTRSNDRITAGNDPKDGSTPVPTQTQKPRAGATAWREQMQQAGLLKRTT